MLMFDASSIKDLIQNKSFVSKKISIIVSGWNSEITELLYDASLNTLLEYGVTQKHIKKQIVPGSMELILTSQLLLENNKTLDGIICLGCIIKGETDHDKYISHAVTHGLVNVSLKYNKPVIFGVLTTNNKQQAFDRSGGKFGNKGEESALALLKMLHLIDNISTK